MAPHLRKMQRISVQGVRFGRYQEAVVFSLPDDKYDQWREIEITFDPSGVRLR